MKATMVIPSYWGRKKGEKRRPRDRIYDHPTPLDEEGTLGRVFKSLRVLRNKDFDCVILGVATGADIRQAVEQKLSLLLQNVSDVVPTRLFSYSHLSRIHSYLEKHGRENFIPLLQLDGYSHVRNLCTILPHLLGSEVAVLIDDDEVFEDPGFMDKALEFIGEKHGEERVLAMAGYYLNPDDSFLLKRKISPWMAFWDKADCMNRAFKATIAPLPRLKPTTFAFGGNLVLHRDLFTRIPFDPAIPRGEDIDFLINARMFGTTIYLDNALSIKHMAPPKASPVWERIREDIFRFVFEREKLRTQEPRRGMTFLAPEDLDPYPGEFLKEDLEQKIFRSNQMLAMDYLLHQDAEGASECMNNILLARTKAVPRVNPFRRLIRLQKKWSGLMDFFSSSKRAREVLERCGYAS